MKDMTIEQRDDFMEQLNKAVDILAEIEALNVLKKECADHCRDVHGIETKKFNKAAKLIHKANAEEEKEFLNEVLEIVEGA